MKGICEDLRKSVLQAAIQGRLSQQCPEDGDAETLYTEIQKEKQKLIKEGKIKKKKPLSEINEDDIPFDIPENWKWVHLHDVICHVGNKNNQILAKEIKSEGKYPVVSQGANLIDGYCDNRERQVLDYPVVMFGDHTKNVKYIDFPFVIGADGTKFMKPILSNPRYLFYWTLFSASQLHNRGYARHYTLLAQVLFPLPPLAEQKRIVARVDELMKRIDEMEKTEKDITALYDAFPGDMKASLLQAAIQGKLTEQLASDGDAETLYAEIQKEKQRLIKEGKIKKEKPLPEITEDDIPFDIPENWKWIRLGECGSWAAGATPSRSNPENYMNGTVPWLKTGDLNDGLITAIPESISTNAFNTSSVRLNPVGSVLMAMYGATIGKLGILGIDATTNQACCACIPFIGIDNKFLFYFLLSSRKRFVEMGAGGAQPNISKEKIVQAIFPLPPLAEQKRIVEKLDQLLPLCEFMKEAIDATA